MIEIINNQRVLILVVCLYFSCTNEQEHWKGGAITEEGDYYGDNFRIEVRDVKGYLKYTMIGKDDLILLQGQDRMSTFQRWALHLDKGRNLWVFSSDIGDYYWEFDSTSNSYEGIKIHGLLNLDSIPQDVRKTLSKFHPYDDM